MTLRPSRSRALAAIALAVWAQLAAARQEPFTERVEVARVLVDARVFDASGRPVSDLGPSDFAVRIAGKPVRVESAEWVGGAPGETQPPLEPGAAVPSADSPGRLVVFLVQKDFEPLRILGLMQVSLMVETLLRPLTRDDRVAVLSFDSRLRIWTDFTNNLGRVRAILSDEVLLRSPAPVNASVGASLMERLDPHSAERVDDMEDALLRIAEALEPLPGAKSLVLLGYGFGRFDARSGGVSLTAGYDSASAALQRARVAVFSLNVTQAHHNSLQAGLESVAADTGGMYRSSYEFPMAAIRQVSHALAGYYVLFVEKPALGIGVHPIEVGLTVRRGTVHARTSYVAEP